MEHLFSINAEGGPLLCLDAHAAHFWKGVEGGGSDYEDLCATLLSDSNFSAEIAPIYGQAGIVWEMNGPGSADVFLQPSGEIVIVRAWLAEESTRELLELASRNPDRRLELGSITFPSGILAILWAAESGERIPHEFSGRYSGARGTVIGDSAFSLKLTQSFHDCFDEVVNTKRSVARRLILRPYQGA